MKNNIALSARKTSLGLLLVASTILLINSSIASAQQYKKITRFGTSQAVCAGGVETVEELQTFFAKNPNAIKQILDDAGFSGNHQDLVKAIEAGDITERSYPVGTKLAWSSAKVDGSYVAKPFREWAGSKSFEAFQIDLNSQCNVYHIAIPKACCNISLISIEQDTSSACKPAVAAVVEEAPAEVASSGDSESKAGLIPFLGLFAGSETRPRFESAWQMDKVDSSGIIGVRAGLLKELTAKTSVFGQASYYDRQGVNGGNVYPENNFAFDLGLERKLSQHMFIGGGLGVWNLDDSDFRDASLFGHIGGDIGKSNFQWLVEGRVFESDSITNDSISDNRMFSAGIRYLIK
jgi:hypothetical protein